MTQQNLRRGIEIFLALGLTILFTLGTGCGGGGGGGSQSAAAGGGSNTPPVNPATTGALTFNFVRAQQSFQVPNSTSSLRFRFFSGANGSGQLLSEQTRPFATSITIGNLSPNLVSVQITAFDNQGVPLAQTTIPATVVVGSSTVVPALSQFGPVTATSLSVLPLTATTNIGGNQQFTANLNYSSGDTVAAGTVAWTSTSQASIGANSGLATGLSEGSATIRATVGSLTSTATLTVTADGTTFNITPATGSVAVTQTLDFDVTATDGNNNPVSTNGTTFSLINGTGTATINATTGVVTGVSQGSATVTASLGSLSSSAALTITPPPMTTVSGRITYEQPTLVTSIGPNNPNPGISTLNFANQFSSPCRFIKVQLIDSGNTVLANARTDASGDYSLTVPAGTNQFKIRAFAETDLVNGQSGRIQVVDNTNAGAAYAADSSLVDPSTTTINLHIPSGYNTTGQVVSTRSSGSFACADHLLSGYQYFIAAGIDASALPTCKVNWSVLNRPAFPIDLPTGAIGTSFYNNITNELFILGDATSDTDEFDPHLLVHEFGHWVQSNRFRDDSPGGAHAASQIKDARLAFSEGFGNAVSGLALDNAIYSDTALGGGFSFSLEYNLSASDVSTSGWTSEFSIQNIIFDLFDPVASEASGYTDNLQLPSSGLLAALDVQRSSSALTTVFSFLDGLDNNLTASQISNLDTLLAFMSPSANFGLNSRDQFAVGETHNAGVATALPLYTDVSSNIDNGVLSFLVPGQIFEIQQQQNWMQGNRYMLFLGTGNRIQVAADNANSAVGNIALRLVEAGTLVDVSVPSTPGESTSVSRDTTLNSIYVVILTNMGTTTSTTDISLTTVPN